MSRRLPDWPERLAEFLAERNRMPFVWGLNDCALFAADWVWRATDEDPAFELRGSYGNEAEALSVIQRFGSLEAIAESKLRRIERVLAANRGDVVCVDVPVGDGAISQTLGIVAGNGSWAAPGARGIVYRPMHEVELVYAVG